MKQSPTNQLTEQILKYLFSQNIFCWRQNISGIPLPSGGFRPSGKTGLPDIIAILPPAGKFLGIEIKTGKDRLRPEQVGFHSSARKMGAEVLTVKTFEDFLQQLGSVL